MGQTAYLVRWRNVGEQRTGSGVVVGTVLEADEAVDDTDGKSDSGVGGR
jgi:hypothetical protein